jgi:hypothetical protein
MIVCSQGERLEAVALFERRQVRAGLAIESPIELRQQTAVRCGSETSRSGVAQVRPGSPIPATTDSRRTGLVHFSASGALALQINARTATELELFSRRRYA